jgi:hypothetical protein
MHVPRVISAAVLTAVTASSLSQAILPASQDGHDSSAVGQAASQQYAEDHRGELDAARRKAETLADAINSDHLTPGALSPDERAADDVLGSLLRRP